MARPNAEQREQNGILEAIKQALKIADMVAYRHFPSAFPKAQYPYVDRNGNPIPIAEVGKDTAPAAYNVYGKNGRLGRKPTADKVRSVYATTNELMLDQIASKADDIVRGLIAAAVGVRAMRMDRHGNEVEVYLVPPDPKAADMLMNRLLGKPTEYRDIVTENTNNDSVHIFIPREGGGSLPIYDGMPVLESGDDSYRRLESGETTLDLEHVAPINGKRPKWDTIDAEWEDLNDKR